MQTLQSSRLAMFRVTNRTNKCNLHEEIALSDEVQKFPCLYNRASCEYKDEESVRKAWKTIEEILGYGEGDGSRRFENLKKRYSKKRNDVKRAARLGSAAELSTAERELDAYSFFSWLDPYIRARCPKIGPTPLDEEEDEKPVIILETGTFGSPNNEARNTIAPDSSRESDISSSPPLKVSYDEGRTVERSHANIVGPSISVCREIRAPESSIPIYESNISNYENTMINYDTSARVSTTMPPAKVRRADESTVPSRDADELFGEIVVAEIRNFPPHLKFLVKHEINEVIFKYQMKEYGSPDINALSSPSQVSVPSHFSGQSSGSKQRVVTSCHRSGLPRGYYSDIDSSR